MESMKLNILLFADDVVLLANSSQDLQKLLDAVYEYSQKWRFRWNCAKSKVMCFGSRNEQKQRFFLGKYLGVLLQANLSWTGAKKAFEDRAKTRIPLITKTVIEGLSVKTGEKLWESMLRPVLEYAAEAWGDGDWKQAEQIQDKVGRTLLGLSKNTPGEVPRGELDAILSSSCIGANWS